MENTDSKLNRLKREFALQLKNYAKILQPHQKRELAIFELKKSLDKYLEYSTEVLASMDKKIRQIEKQVGKTEKSLKSLEKMDKKRDVVCEKGEKMMKKKKKK